MSYVLNQSDMDFISKHLPGWYLYFFHFNSFDDKFKTFVCEKLQNDFVLRKDDQFI